jgi:hypothetical protein
MKHGEASGQAKAPIVDPYLVQNIIADDILNIQIDGTLCTIEFGKRRFRERPGQPPILERVIVNRLVLTIDALNEMMNRLVGMRNVVEQALKRHSPDTKPH